MEIKTENYCFKFKTGKVNSTLRMWLRTSMPENKRATQKACSNKIYKQKHLGHLCYLKKQDHVIFISHVPQKRPTHYICDSNIMLYM